MDFAPIETPSIPDLQPIAVSETALPSAAIRPDPTLSKNAIRTSLRASTIDGVFATVFSNIAGGVLLSNFLVSLDASPVEIGMLSSIPMLVNLIQPLGAYLGDKLTSRHWYCLWIYIPSRLFWLILLAAIAIAPSQYLTSPQLVQLTLAIVVLSHFLGALGSAAWLSWMAALVPRRLRGRYFGIRNSAASLTNLLCVPLGGFVVSTWHGGAIQGYGVVLAIGIIAGIISIGFQYFMMDVNPQEQKLTSIRFRKPQLKPSEQHSNQGDTTAAAEPQHASPGSDSSEPKNVFQDFNFLRFLVYFGGWMFAVNLSAPFFNVYLLDNLKLDVSLVTLYTSLGSGANLLMLIWWGRIADRVGNRFILLLVGILVALTPILWLGTGDNFLSIWLWFPLLHMLAGGTWAAIDLCGGNMQLGVAPVRNQATYFAIAAAVAGVSGALGTTAGGFMAEISDYGGIPGVFAFSTILRLLALLPLVFVHEQDGRSVKDMIQRLLLPLKPQLETDKGTAPNNVTHTVSIKTGDR